MEKQNLQEAAKNYAIDNSLIGYEKMPFNGFIAGANWQQEKSYNEDEVIQLIDNFRNSKELDLIKWFSLNKK